MIVKNLFERVEHENQIKLESKYSGQFKLVNKVLKLFMNHLLKAEGFKIDDHPQITVINLLTQNLKYLNKAFIELTKGYFRIPSSLLKTSTEQLLYALVFAEFHELESEYLHDGYKKFTSRERNTKLNLMKRLDEHGKLFRQDNVPDFWDRVLRREMYRQLNMLSHPDPSFIFSIMFDESTKQFSIGPRIQPEKQVKGLIRIILLSSLLSIVALDAVFSIDRTDSEVKLLNQATDELNRLVVEDPVSSER